MLVKGATVAMAFPQSVYHARTQIWKKKLFRGFLTQKHPFSHRKRRFWGPIKHIFFKQHAFFSSYKMKYLFVKVRIIACNWRHYSMDVVFFITSNVWSKLKCNSNMWNKQTEIHVDACKILPFFKISLTHDFVKSGLPLQICHFFFENGY